jgi:hypothetical protein
LNERLMDGNNVRGGDTVAQFSFTCVSSVSDRIGERSQSAKKLKDADVHKASSYQVHTRVKAQPAGPPLKRMAATAALLLQG